jgi:hypothetical protein
MREIVKDAILIEPAMAATALALYLTRSADAETVAALARELTLEYLARLIRGERANAAAAPYDGGVANANGTGAHQPFLPEYVEQLSRLPEVIPNRAGDPVQTLKAKYADLRDHLNLLNRQYWAKRANDPEIVATKSLLHVMHPHWKENQDITLEEALILESGQKRHEGGASRCEL